MITSDFRNSEYILRALVPKKFHPDSVLYP